MPPQKKGVKSMIKIAIDWSVTRDMVYTQDGKKVKKIPATKESFQKFLDKLNGDIGLYFEAGGGDVFKLMANQKGYKIFTIPGKRTKEEREKLNIEKTDENDVVIIHSMAVNKPKMFRQFNERDILVSKICIAFKSRQDVEESLVRAKNRLFALESQMDLLNIPKKDREKWIQNKKAIIEQLEKDFTYETKSLEKLVKQHPLWESYFKDEKGIGPAVAGGIISQVKDVKRFDDKYSLRHYAGMITKKGNNGYNRKLKRALYFFATGIIKNKNPKWRELYDNMKIYYADKHSDWKPGKVNNYAIKFVQTKFLDNFYKKSLEVG